MSEEETSDDQHDETVAAVSINTGPMPELTHILRDGVDVRGRNIYICGEIEEGEGGDFLQAVVHMEQQSKEPIFVWISSPGGDVSAEFVMHDVIRTASVKIVTIGIGEVSSAAGLILACGHKRYVTESTVFMAHEPKMGDENVGIGLRSAKNRRPWEDWTQEHWAELMSRYCKGSKAFWKGAVEKRGEYWLIGGAAIVEAEVADEILRGAATAD